MSVTENLILFHDLMEEAGLNEQEPIVPAEYGEEVDVFHIGDDVLWFVTYIYFTSNKTSYLFHRFNADEDGFNVDKLLHIAENIDWNNPGQVGEVGWKVQFKQPPSLLGRGFRDKALKFFTKVTRKKLRHGMLTHIPTEHSSLVADPRGLKIGADDVRKLEDLSLGKRQRAIFAKRLGFGDVGADGYCYAKYNNDGKVIPR